MERRKVFLNLPVADLARSIAFFKAMGFQFNAQFTDETAACLVISEEIYAMLLTHAKFKEFTPRTICDARESSEVLIALACQSREEMATWMERALAAGASRVNPPKDYGFMQQDGFQDLDGHIWELFVMDPSFVQPMVPV